MTNMTRTDTPDPAKRWSLEDFEMQIEDMMDAAYKTPVDRKSATMKARASRITPGIIEGIRNTVPHMPGKDRIVLPRTIGFDLDNDPLPERACISIPGEEEGRQIGYLRRMNGVVSWRDLAALDVARMPDDMPWYRVTYLFTKRRALRGCTVWCWIDAAGKVRLADSPGLDTAKDNTAPMEDMISTTLQAQADRRFCWEIAADEGFAKASLGCTAEEVKSLLYARQLPVTATGRKRPILHLVAAHRRRMKEGIDVDIRPFLRGVSEVTMDGTQFKVRAPQTGVQAA